MKSIHPMIVNTSRRRFMQGALTAGAGLSLGFHWPRAAQAQMSTQGNINAWIDITPDNQVILRYARAEMGQGSLTSAPMLIAEELEVPWSSVKVVYATAHENLRQKRAFGDMASVGSRTARTLLVSAAAQTWGVSESQCRAQAGKVVHTPSGRHLMYGDLVVKAAGLPVPSSVSLKDPSQWTVIGKSIARVDIPDIVVGKVRYGIDTQLPGMLHAAVAACPVFNGKVKSIDDSKVKNRRGVVQVLNLQGFVAVVADNWWRAKEALREVEIEWDVGAHGSLTTAKATGFIREGLEATQVAVARNDGDVMSGLGQSVQRIQADYFTPYLAHATMEPMVCTAWLQGDQLQVWSSTQNPEATLATAANAAGVPLANVTVHPVQLGGGLGRKSPQDFTRQAVQIAKAMEGKPVKMLWSREEDIQHDLYRPASWIRLEAGIDAKGQMQALKIRSAGPSLLASLLRLPLKDGVDPQAVAALADHPYSVANSRVEYAQRDTNIPVGFWRTVGHSQNPFARECFIDEVAAAAGQDPKAFRLAHLSDKSEKDRRILQAVCDAAGWDKPLPKGVFRGLAETEGYGSWTACVCEVSVSSKGDVKIHRVVIGIDPGYAVNPNNIQAQMQGSVVHGLSAIFWGEMTVRDGRIEQSNFHDYRLMRLNEMPKVETVIAPTGGFWGGVGEPAQAPLAPALVNAICAATGKRIRSLPLKNHGLRLVT
jgi:isoquinoline 1-oxidoreductase beta subunit